MDTDSKITGTLEERYYILGSKVDVLAQKVDDFIAESRRVQDRQDSEMRALNQRIDTAINQMHNMTIAVGAGVGAMVVAIIVFLATK